MDRRKLVILALVALSACSTATEGTVDTTTFEVVPGTDDPAAAVSELFAALAANDYQRAAQLTVDDQVVAIAVAEDSSVSALEAVLENGGTDVAANYWSGFSANLDELLGVAPGDVSVGQVTPIEVDGNEFARVELNLPVDAASRRFVVQHSDGWKVDVVATFAPTLAARLARAADSLRADPGATEVRRTLARQRSSLEAALRSGNIDGATAQVIRQAIETLGT